jgi:bacterioferritin-associated ferredoxin
MYLCLCKGITESDVKRLAYYGTTTEQALIAALGLSDADCCGRCLLEIDVIDVFVALAASEWLRVDDMPGV